MFNIMSSDTDDTVHTESGNTKIRSLRSRGWTFTLNNYSESDIAQLTQFFDTMEVRYIFQEEMSGTGTPHLQGLMYFKNARSWSSIKQIDNRMHIEVCRSVNKSVKYCQKLDTRTGEIYSKGFKIVEIKDVLSTLKLYDWQQKIVDLCKTDPDDRTINWYYDLVGDVGKTKLAKHLCLRHGAIYVGGSSSDIKYAISKMKEKPKIVIFGYPRTKKDYVSYQALEEIKDGIFFNTKYESAMTIFNSPHVIVLANFRPDESKMSKDRWNIIEISNEDRTEELAAPVIGRASLRLRPTET